jgi:hypothetical protein
LRETAFHAKAQGKAKLKAQMVEPVRGLNFETRSQLIFRRRLICRR